MNEVRLDSPPPLRLTSFSHIPALHLCLTDSGAEFNGLALGEWLRSALTPIVLSKGMSFHLSLSTFFSSYTRPFWALHGILPTNPTGTTVYLAERTMYLSSDSYIEQYTFISHEDI